MMGERAPSTSRAAPDPFASGRAAVPSSIVPQGVLAAFQAGPQGWMADGDTAPRYRFDQAQGTAIISAQPRTDAQAGRADPDDDLAARLGTTFDLLDDLAGDVLLTRPYDPKRPQACLDETSRQLLADATPPRPMAPGVPAKEDYEYVRQGVANLFLVCEPLRGWREVLVSDRRTRIDWARCVKDLIDVHCPDADTIVLVQDNLNTHTPASFTRRSPRPKRSA
jgi:hypothetical protein